MNGDNVDINIASVNIIRIIRVRPIINIIKYSKYSFKLYISNCFEIFINP